MMTEENAKAGMDYLRAMTMERFMRLPEACRMACLAALAIKGNDIRAFSLIKGWF